MIASPTYDGSVRKEYMQSILHMTDYFRSEGIAFELLLEPATVLHVMRSVMASKALRDEDITHLLFVDTDMGFPVDAVRKLIRSGKDVIGCACPFRTIPLHDTVSQSGGSFRKAISEILPYALKFPPGTATIDIAGGICEVTGIGTGLLLISKQALKIMQDKGGLGTFAARFPYSQWYSGETYFGFFEHVIVDGAYLGEDYSFCHRRTESCGGKVYALVDEEIMHIGPLPVLGRYIDKLKAGKL